MDTPNRSTKLAELLNKMADDDEKPINESNTMLWGMVTNMERFSGQTEWEKFQEQMELKVSFVTEDESMKKRILLSVLTAEIFQEVSNHVPRKLADASYDEITEALAQLYGSKWLVWVEIKNFRSARMGVGETVNQFYNRLKQIARRCEFPDNERQITEQLLVGLGPEMFNKISELPRDVSLKDALAACTQTEFRIANKMALEKNMDVRQVLAKGVRHEIGNKVEASRDSTRRSGVKQKKCWRCASPAHSADKCKFHDEKCYECGKIGHIRKTCKLLKKGVSKMEEEAEEKVDNIKVSSLNPIMLRVTLNGKEVDMELDSGSRYTILRLQTMRSLFTDLTVKRKKGIRLRSFSGQDCQLEGAIMMEVGYEGKLIPLEVLVVRKGTGELLGRDFIEKFGMQISTILRVQSSTEEQMGAQMVDQLIDAFPSLFSERLGKATGAPVSLETTADLKPVFCRPREIPYAYEKRVGEQIDQLVREGVLEKLEYSEFGTPLVIVPKANGELRICGDYKSTINRYLRDFNHPIPTPEEIFRKLAGCKYFFKLDLRSAYNQICLDEGSSKLCAWSTHKGVFALKRMPFGIKPASGLFQRDIDKRLSGLERVAPFIDDIIGGAETPEELRERLVKVFTILQESGFSLRREKCQLCVRSLKVLGHVISATGVAKDEEKVAKILEIEPPRDVKEVQSFCGLINYYSKFMPRLADLLRPIYALVKKGRKFKWSNECQTAFDTVKREMATDVVLAHYEPRNRLILVTDASEHSISAVLLTVIQGQERPLAYWARTMNQAELNYSVVDKEALAVVGGCKRFRKYLLGRRFTLRTDQKSLEDF